MEELLPVNITIADRNYRIKIETKDEETVRKTVKLINDKILEYKNVLAGKDMQDFVSMALLWFATEKTKDNQFLNSSTIDSELDGIIELLSKKDS